MRRNLQTVGLKNVNIRLRATLLSALTLAAGLTAAAQGGDETRLADGIAAAFADAEQVECHYAMERRVSLLADAARDEGTLTFDRRGRTLTLASTATPGDSTIMTPAALTTVERGRRTTVEARRVAALRQMTDLVAACFSGDFAAVRAAGTLEMDADARHTTARFTPRDRRVARHVDTILLTFDNSDYALRQMEVRQKNGDFTLYRFGKPAARQKVVPLRSVDRT